jgi:hypothetical protein
MFKLIHGNLQADFAVNRNNQQHERSKLLKRSRLKIDS